MDTLLITLIIAAVSAIALAFYVVRKEFKSRNQKLIEEKKKQEFVNQSKLEFIVSAKAIENPTASAITFRDGMKKIHDNVIIEDLIKDLIREKMVAIDNEDYERAGELHEEIKRIREVIK